MEKIHLKRTKRLLAGHLWVFSNELYESPKRYEPGSLVEVCDMKDNFLGTGYINPKSLIAIRLLSRTGKSIDRDLLKGRISDAVALRGRLLPSRKALRLIYSEADYLPGLIVDQYEKCISVQFLTLGMEKLKDIFLELLDEILNPEVIVVRNDSRSRTLEGLPLYKEIAKGNLDPLPSVREDGVIFEINPLEGQKTGLFLDQEENRRALSEITREGKGLDLFCYNGAWALRLARAGARVIGVDSSERALAHASKNAELNGLSQRISFVKEDVFAFLGRELESSKAKYDFIVCDPPAFVKSSENIREGVRAYTDLNEKCMALLRNGGLLATSSCSYQLGREIFIDMLNTAAKHAGKRLRLLELRSQGRDHPVLLSMPETAYLKCAFLVVDSLR